MKVTVTATERALTMSERTVLKVAPTVSSMTWKPETGSKVKVPGPVAEKSYRADTVNGFSSTNVGNVVFGLKSHRRALQSQSCRRG